MREELKPPVYIVGVKRFWKPSWRQFFGYLQPVFVSSPNKVPAGANALIWGVTVPDYAFAPGVTVYRVEDGFIRSVGLGAEFTRPLSWVVDSRGIYFDASRPSDLEHLLQFADISVAHQQRAEQLINHLVANGISKYNTGNGDWQRPATDKPIILVPGQVEQDASIKLGSPTIKTNLALLKQVRANNPDAYIIYKPHPDVVAGARAQGQDENLTENYCDQIVTSVSIDKVLSTADEVHTMTSLTGFEGLIRGKTVHCYGQPFYSGWGLTTDHYPQPRRTRQRTLLELAAATLILYPRYVVPNQPADTGLTVGPENVIACIQQQKTHNTLVQRTQRQLAQLVKRAIRKLLNQWR